MLAAPLADEGAPVRVVLGTTTVTVTLGVALVVAEPGFDFFGGGEPGWDGVVEGRCVPAG